MSARVKGAKTAAASRDRAATARLDYLALGDWHGTRRIDARTWYSGTPEPDRFKANEPGNVLQVDIARAGAEPIVFAGFVISNSETGGGAFSVTPRLVVKVCNNGLTITADALRAIKATGVDTDAIAGDTGVRTPITGEVILSVRTHSEDDIDAAIAGAAAAFPAWATSWRRCRSTASACPSPSAC